MCVCSCTHTRTHTLRFEPKGQDETHGEPEESISIKSLEYMCTKYITKIFVSSKKEKKKCKRNIKTSHPAGFEQIDPTGRVLDYLCE